MPDNTSTPLLLTLACALLLFPLFLSLFVYPIFHLVPTPREPSPEASPRPDALRLTSRLVRPLLVATLVALGLGGSCGLAALNGVSHASTAGGVFLLLSSLALDSHLTMRLLRLPQQLSRVFPALLGMLLVASTVLHALLLSKIDLHSSTVPIIRATIHAVFDLVLASLWFQHVLAMVLTSQVLEQELFSSSRSYDRNRFSNPWRPSSSQVSSPSLSSRLRLLLRHDGLLRLSSWRLFLLAILSMGLSVGSAIVPVAYGYDAEWTVAPDFFGIVTSPVAYVAFSALVTFRVAAVALDLDLPTCPPGLPVHSRSPPCSPTHQSSTPFPDILKAASVEVHSQPYESSTTSSLASVFRPRLSTVPSRIPASHPPSQNSPSPLRRTALSLSFDRGAFTPPGLRTPKRTSAAPLQIDVVGGDPFAREPSAEAKEMSRKRLTSQGEEELEARLSNVLGAVVEEAGFGDSKASTVVHTESKDNSSEGFQDVDMEVAYDAEGDDETETTTHTVSSEAGYGPHAPTSGFPDSNGVASAHCDPFPSPHTLVRPSFRARASAPPETTTAFKMLGSLSSNGFGWTSTPTLIKKRVQQARQRQSKGSAGSSLSFSCVGDSGDEASHGDSHSAVDSMAPRQDKVETSGVGRIRVSRPQTPAGLRALRLPSMVGIDSSPEPTSTTTMAAKGRWTPLQSTTKPRPRRASTPESPSIRGPRRALSTPSLHQTVRYSNSPMFVPNPKRSDPAPPPPPPTNVTSLPPQLFDPNELDDVLSWNFAAGLHGQDATTALANAEFSALRPDSSAVTSMQNVVSSWHRSTSGSVDNLHRLSSDSSMSFAKLIANEGQTAPFAFPTSPTATSSGSFPSSPLFEGEGSPGLGLWPDSPDTPASFRFTKNFTASS